MALLPLLSGELVVRGAGQELVIPEQVNIPSQLEVVHAAVYMSIVSEHITHADLIVL